MEKVDNTPYELSECRKRLSRGTDVDHAQFADKIVVYKKKRKLLMYKQGGEVLYSCRISLGKTETKGTRYRREITGRLRAVTGSSGRSAIRDSISL